MKLHTARGEFDIGCDSVYANDPALPTEYNPNHRRLWLIGNEYGPLLALWADSVQEALDEMLDRGHENFLVASEDFDQETDDAGEYARLGNAGELCDLTYAWIEEVRVDAALDFGLCLSFAEARGACKNTLWG